MMDNPFSLNGKTILVTGASSGIGRGIAIACSKMGARVILTARSEQRLKETLEQCDGDCNECFCADLIEKEDRNKLVERLPKLDGFVQCAGIMNRVPCKAIVAKNIQQVFMPNLDAPILLQSELLQEKKISNGASVIYIASLAAHSAVAGNALYSASKAALESYAKCLALELAPRQIRVNCICPAMVWTDLAFEGTTQEELEADQQRYPLKRYGKPDDIANLAIYLLSDASTWMTGSSIEITGGAKE